MKGLPLARKRINASAPLFPNFRLFSGDSRTDHVMQGIMHRHEKLLLSPIRFARSRCRACRNALDESHCPRATRSRDPADTSERRAV
jgi:hypothetical protein